MEDFYSIIFAIVIAFGTFVGSLFALHYFWLKPHFSEIPVNEDMPSSSLRNRIRNEEVKTVKNLKDMLQTYLPLIINLDTKYWVKNIGLDGYVYLYFQKQIIKMLILFLIVYCLVVIPVSIYYGKIHVPQDPTEFTLETSNAKIKYHQELRSILDCFLVYFISLYSIYVMFKIKAHVKSILYQQNNSKSDREEFARMKARSVHVSGAFPEDRRGELLISEINSFLDASLGGRIVSSIIIHDFIKVVELENKRKSVDNAHKLYIANEPAVRRVCFPSKYRQEEYYKKKLRQIDDQIEAELMKPLLCAGHAFICFDSVKTRNYCLEYFKEDAKNTLSTFWSLITNREAATPNKKKAMRKVTSTFQKFDEEDAMRKLKNQDMPLIMKPLSNPVDIFWANMGGGRGFFLLRRLIINIIGLLILVFLSTPASMLTAMKETEIFKFVDVSQYVPDDSGFGTFIKETLPPLMIISLNQLLLLLIDYAAYMEKHSTFTGCQISIFYKSLFYLTLNMLIVPAFTLATADSLFKILIYEGNSVAEVLKQFYFSSPGGFFIIILLQNGAFSSSFHLLRIADIFNAFGSTWLAYYQRNYINDTEKWRKQESDVFQYGYLYGQIVTAYAIIISYSVSTPGIMLAGLSFFLMRYSVDGYNLLTVFKMEIDSGGKLIESILDYATGACLLLQVALAISFWSSGYIVSFTLIFLLFLITLFLCYRIQKPITEEQETEVDDIENNLEDQREQIQIWEAAYKHPLLVSPSEVGITRDVRTVSYVLPDE